MLIMSRRDDRSKCYVDPGSPIKRSHQKARRKIRTNSKISITPVKSLIDLRANSDTVQQILRRIDRSFSIQDSKFNVSIEIPKIGKTAR
jgi:hypothetical protein